MKSKSDLLTLYQKFTENESTENQTTGLILINDSIRTIATKRGGKWWWLETIVTFVTVADQQGYYIPASVRKIVDAYTAIGTTTYMPEVVYDPDRWKMVLASNLGTSDIPMFIYRQGRQVLLAPTPASVNATVTIRARINVPDLTTADYTTGTITTATNGSKAIVGSGTTWTALMVGRYLRITGPTGDGLWYRISAYISATSLTLETPYEGTSIAAGSAAYTIGEMSPLPESYDTAPVYRAAAIYWATHDQNRSIMWWRLYDGGKEAALIPANAPVGGLLGEMLQEAAETVEGAYVPPFRNGAYFPKGSILGQQDAVTGL